MRLALIISTYNSPEFLRLILSSVRLQTRMPDQLIIADDGSSESTAQVVEQSRKSFDFQMTHCWQQDIGFRKTRILNQAILAADAEYLVFSDGDMLLHPRYLADHAEIARPGRYVQGRRICLNQKATQRQLAGDNPRVRFWQRGVNRRPQMVRSRFLMRHFSGQNTSLKNSRGCNQSFWRDDLLAVDGYEQSMQGWGREDSELCARLHNLGRNRIYARHFALAYHLYHPELSRDRDELNQQHLQQTIDSGNTRAQSGLSSIAWQRAA